MVEVHVYRRALGNPDQSAVMDNEVDGDFASKVEAQDWIRATIASFEFSGYNEERDYWWCRNAGEAVTTIFAIAPTLEDRVATTAQGLGAQARWKK